MKLFAPMYERAMRWASNPRAWLWLTLLSFAEAVIFPVPPEVMLAPMALSRPQRAFRFAALSLAGSLLGSLLGYALGHYAFEWVKPAFAALGWLDGIDRGIETIRLKMSVSPWAVFWFLVAGGFTPIPLKFFTWASGIVGVPLLPFVASMAVGRGKRVFLIALAIRLGGARAEAALRRWIEPIGWAATALLVAAVGYFAWSMQTQ